MEKSKKENQDVHSEDKDLLFEKLFERIETRLDEIEGKLMKHIDEKYAEIESKNAKNFSIEEMEKKLKKIKVPISDTEKTREKQKTYGLDTLSHLRIISTDKATQTETKEYLYHGSVINSLSVMMDMLSHVYDFVMHYDDVNKERDLLIYELVKIHEEVHEITLREEIKKELMNLKADSELPEHVRKNDGYLWYEFEEYSAKWNMGTFYDRNTKNIEEYAKKYAKKAMEEKKRNWRGKGWDFCSVADECRAQLSHFKDEMTAYKSAANDRIYGGILKAFSEHKDRQMNKKSSEPKEKETKKQSPETPTTQGRKQ